MILSIIIVNYNTSHFINQTIRSIKKSTLDINYEIIIVDNNSNDQSIDLIKKQFTKVKLIENPSNYGFSKAVNIGVSNAEGKYILILNPDTILKKDTILELYQSLVSDSNIGVVGGKILDCNGKFQLSSRRAFPSFLTSIFHILGLSYLFPKTKLFGKYNYTYKPSNTSHAVDAVSGACMMFSRNHFNLTGGFDERYFLFFEETDFCRETQKLGKKVFYNGNAETIHYRGESMKTASFNVDDVFFDSLLKFYDKQGPLYMRLRLLRPFLKFAYKLKKIVDTLKINFRLLLQSFFDFLSISIAYFIAIPIWYFIYYEHLIENIYFIKHLPLLISYFLIWVCVASIFKIYRKGFSIDKEIALVNILVFFIASTIIYFFNSIAYSRAILFLIFFQTFIYSMLWRYVLSFYSSYKILKSPKIVDVFFQRVAFVGTSNSMIDLITKIENQNNIYKNIVGYFDTSKKDVENDYLGSIDSIVDSIQNFNIDEIIISESDVNKLNIFNLLSKVSGRSVIVKILPSDGNILLSKGLVEFIDDVSLIKLELPYLDIKHRFVKRSFDFIFSFLFIIITIPFHIYYSFYTLNHRRFFCGSKVIDTYNYSSKSKLIQKLPYLWLILRGQISFVGTELSYNESDDKSLYLLPGLTGLHIVNSNNRMTNKTKYDFYYMENYSIFLDIEIIFRTISNK